jgi:hypothetical protein
MPTDALAHPWQPMAAAHASMSCACTARANNAVNACDATRRVVAGASRKRNYFWNFSHLAQNPWETTVQAQNIAGRRWRGRRIVPPSRHD